MKKIFPILLTLTTLALLVAACSGAPASPPATDVADEAHLDEPTQEEQLQTTQEEQLQATQVETAVAQDTVTAKEATERSPESATDPKPIMPFITEDHQGFTYGPGQRVIVIVEGFAPGDTLDVTLFHQEQGQLDAFAIENIDQRGKAPIYHTVDGSYPDGDFYYHVSGSNGVEKTYSFALDHSQVVDSVPFEGCGVYPEPALGSTVIAWCTGFIPEDEPVVVRGLVNGEELFRDDDTLVWDDSVATYLLAIFEDDPAGEWALEFGDKATFTFEIGVDHE